MNDGFFDQTRPAGEGGGVRFCPPHLANSRISGCSKAGVRQWTALSYHYLGKLQKGMFKKQQVRSVSGKRTKSSFFALSDNEIGLITFADPHLPKMSLKGNVKMPMHPLCIGPMLNKDHGQGQAN